MRTLAALVSLSVTLSPAAARAGNDDEVTIGNQAAMAAGAVTATGSDGASAWYNPAGIAAVSENTVDVSGSAFAIRHYRMPGFLSASTGEWENANTTELVSIPSAISLVRRVSDRVNVGLGVFVPRTSDIRVRELLFTDTPASAWILDLAAASQSYHAGATIGVRAHDTVRIGVTLGGIYNTQSARAEFYGGVIAPDGTTGVFGGTVDISAWTVGVEAALGLQWDPTDALSLGVSVRSPSLDIYSSVTTNLVETFAVAGGMTSPDIRLVPTTVEESGVDFASLSPPRIRASIAWRSPRGWLALDGDVQPGWTDETFGVDREPVVNVRVGGIFRVAEGLSLGAGFFTDRASDPDPVDIADTRADFYGGTLGVTFDNVHALAEEEEADRIVFSSTVAIRYAYGSGEAGDLYVNYDPGATDVVEPWIGDLEVHEVGLHIGSALYF